MSEQDKTNWAVFEFLCLVWLCVNNIVFYGFGVKAQEVLSCYGIAYAALYTVYEIFALVVVLRALLRKKKLWTQN